MKTSGIIFNIVLVALTVSLLCVWFYPSVEDFIAGNRMWNGVKDFTESFEAENLESIDELAAAPVGIAMVAIPYLEYAESHMDRMREYLENGGTLLVMDDYGYGNTILEYLGVTPRFSGDTLLDPLFNYKNQYLPRVTDFAPAVTESGVDVILLNYATALTGLADADVLAWSSEASYLDSNANGSLDSFEAAGPHPVAAEIACGKGRLILVADPSIVINTMVGRDDNNAFVEWLMSRHGDVTRVVFDNSHLSDTPLDVSKAGLTDTRDLLSKPYPVIGITALAFIGISRFTLRKGEKVG